MVNARSNKFLEFVEYLPDYKIVEKNRHQQENGNDEKFHFIDGSQLIVEQCKYAIIKHFLIILPVRPLRREVYLVGEVDSPRWQVPFLGLRIPKLIEIRVRTVPIPGVL